MRLYESVQANLGLIQAGVGVPGTEIKADVPFTDIQFEQDTVALAGVGAAALGAYLGFNLYKLKKEQLQSEIFTQGSDVAKKSRKEIINGGVRIAGLGLAITALVTGSLFNRAKPYTEESRNLVDEVAVVVDAGYESLAEDVSSDNGEINRVTAAVNGLVLSKYGFSELGDNVKVSFIAAGDDPEYMGQIIDGTREEKEEILDAFENYATATQLGTESNGGGDIEGALALAEATDPDVLIVVNSDLEGHEQSPSFERQAEEGENRVSVIALGQPGSTVDLLTGTVDAPVNVAFNNLIVGKENSYQVENMDELADVVGDIIDNEIIETERQDYDGYDKLVKFGLIGIVALSIYEYVMISSSRSIRKLKKFINGK